MPEPIILEVFSDYVCPWCYLGDNRVKKLKENYNIEVKLVHFPLHPDTPEEGRTLQDMFGTGPEDIQAKNTRMKGLMDTEGLPYNERSHTYNSRLAQEIGSWAETQFLTENDPIFPMRCMTHGFAEWAVRSSLEFIQWFTKRADLPNRFAQFLDRMGTKPK